MDQLTSRRDQLLSITVNGDPQNDPFLRDRALFDRLSRERAWPEGTWVLIMNNQVLYAGPSEREAYKAIDFSLVGQRAFLECVGARP